MIRLRRGRFPSAGYVALLVILALTTFPLSAETREPERLQVERIRVPPVVALEEPMFVSVTASDTLGVAAVELRLEGRVQRLTADGSERVVVSARLLPREAGYLPLEVRVVGVDGARGPAVRELLPVGDHSSDEPVEKHAALERRLRDWEAAGANPYALYARGSLYRRVPPERAQTARAGVLRRVDTVRDQLQLSEGFPGLGKALHFNWWRSWLASAGPQPFDWQTFCGNDVTGVTPGGEVLECWLAMRPLVRAALVWREVDPNTGDVTVMAYDDWPFYLKNFLNVNFHHYWTWLEGGAGPDFPGIELPAIPVNQVQLEDGQPAVTALGGYAARSLYIQTVAHTLALEIGGFLPWSILGYGSFTDITRILSSEYLLHAGHYDKTHVDNPKPVVFNGWWPYGDTTHAPPTVSFRFLVEENILRPTHYDTIARLMKWSREEMSHYGGGATAENMENHWGYRGDPPVANILSTWPRMFPAGPSRAWIAGCHGVAYFSQSLMRAANIPVAARKLHNTSAPVHRSPVFYTAGQSVSHGDDVHAMHWVIPSVDPDYVPPDEVFISLQTFFQWFPGTVAGQTANVGRRFSEVIVDVLPNRLMDRYCDDLAAFSSHADGVVYDTVEHHYTVAELEAMNLWLRLAVKETKYDFCDGPFRLRTPVGPGLGLGQTNRVRSITAQRSSPRSVQSSDLPAFAAELPGAGGRSPTVAADDFDGNGLPNASDSDDDNDGLPDAEDGAVGGIALDPDTDDDGVIDGMDRDPDNPRNVLTSCVGPDATLNLSISSAFTCAAEASITTVNPAGVTGTGDLIMIAPNVRLHQGFSVEPGGRLTIIAEDPTTTH